MKISLLRGFFQMNMSVWLVSFDMNMSLLTRKFPFDFNTSLLLVSFD